jgi:hypothetical protein
LQFLGREVALRGLLLENARISRGNRGFQTADMEKFDVGKHFPTFQGDATMSNVTLENILEQHNIPAVYWAELKALVFNGVRSRVVLIQRLHNTPNYMRAFTAILDELSKGVKHKFPPSMRKAS